MEQCVTACSSYNLSRISAYFILIEYLLFRLGSGLINPVRTMSMYYLTGHVYHQSAEWVCRQLQCRPKPGIEILDC